MVTVLHVFNETDFDRMDDHVRFWHGVLRAEHAGDESVVCWCGGRRFDLSDSVCAVWHFGSYEVFSEGVLGD